MNTKNFNFIDKLLAKYRLKEVLKYVEKNDFVLDFGCGNHSFLLENIKTKINKGVGLDYDVENKLEDNIEYRQFKFNNKLPFKDNFFDKVFLLAVLEHIDPKKVIGLFLEFKRVLKVDGQIILTTPTPKSKSLLEFLAYKLKVISEEEIRDHKKYYSKYDISLIIDKAGLKIKSYKKFQLGLNSVIYLKSVMD